MNDENSFSSYSAEASASSCACLELGFIVHHIVAQINLIFTVTNFIRVGLPFSAVGWISYIF